MGLTAFAERFEDVFGDVAVVAIVVLGPDPARPRAVGDADGDRDSDGDTAGADDGDELCCVGRVDLAMGANYLRRLARRVVRARRA